MEQRRGNLAGYARWLFRDYATNQGLATAVVLTLYGYLTIAPQVGGASELADIPAHTVAEIFASLLGSLMLIGTLFATNGIVANDRKLGYYRLMFAKPVAPARYYAVAFAVNGAGLLLVGALLASAFAIVVRPVFSAALFPLLATMYVAYGGIGFLLSALWRYDWLSLVTVAIVASFAWQMWGDAGGVRGALVHLLPPMPLAGPIYAYASGLGSALPWTSVIWLGGYGLVCFVLGLGVLRVRSLAVP